MSRLLREAQEAAALAVALPPARPAVHVAPLPLAWRVEAVLAALTARAAVAIVCASTLYLAWSN